MNIVMKKLEKLKPYEKNPRNNEQAIEPVANSIKEFGFKVPIVVDKDGVIVAGHTRYLASQRLGLEEVPCIVADDLTEEQVKAFRLADNKVSELSSWDFSKLNQELEELSLDMSEFGFDEITDVTDDLLNDFFEDSEQTEKEPKKIQCPHCGEWFEV